MARFEVDVYGDGETWIPTDASSAEKAAEACAREHACDQGWSESVEVRVRDARGSVHVIGVRWSMEMIVNTRTRKVVPRG